MCFYCKLRRELATCYTIRLSLIFGIFIYINKKEKYQKKKTRTLKFLNNLQYNILRTVSNCFYIHVFRNSCIIIAFRHRELDTRLETTTLMFVLNMYCNL